MVEDESGGAGGNAGRYEDGIGLLVVNLGDEARQVGGELPAQPSRLQAHFVGGGVLRLVGKAAAVHRGARGSQGGLGCGPRRHLFGGLHGSRRQRRQSAEGGKGGSGEIARVADGIAAAAEALREGEIGEDAVRREQIQRDLGEVVIQRGGEHHIVPGIAILHQREAILRFEQRQYCGEQGCRRARGRGGLPRLVPQQRQRRFRNAGNGQTAGGIEVAVLELLFLVNVARAHGGAQVVRNVVGDLREDGEGIRNLPRALGGGNGGHEAELLHAGGAVGVGPQRAVGKRRRARGERRAVLPGIAGEPAGKLRAGACQADLRHLLRALHQAQVVVPPEQAAGHIQPVVEVAVCPAQLQGALPPVLVAIGVKLREGDIGVGDQRRAERAPRRAARIAAVGAAAGAVEVLEHHIVAAQVRGDGGEVADLGLQRGLGAQAVHIVDLPLFGVAAVGPVDEGIVAVEGGILRRNVAPVFQAVPIEQHGECLVGLEEQLEVARGVVHRAPAAAGDLVQPVATAALVGEAAAQAEHILHQRHIHAALQVPGVSRAPAIEFAPAAQQARAEALKVGVAPPHHDGAAAGVLALQHGLRPAVDFHLLNIEGVEQLAGAGAEEDIVEQHAGGGVLGLLDIRIALAADVNGAGRRPRGVHADEDIGREAVEIAQGAGREALNGLCGEGRNGHRHILQRLIALAGAHDDLLNAGFGGAAAAGADIAGLGDLHAPQPCGRCRGIRRLASRRKCGQRKCEQQHCRPKRLFRDRALAGVRAQLHYHVLPSDSWRRPPGRASRHCGTISPRFASPIPTRHA